MDSVLAEAGTDRISVRDDELPKVAARGYYGLFLGN